jgi:hypothetical protein
MASVSSKGNQPPQQPPGRWYKKEEFRALPKEHQAWLSYEKKRRDQANKSTAKSEKRRIKAAFRKEKRKLAKLQTKTEKGSKRAKQGGDVRNDSDSEN